MPVKRENDMSSINMVETGKKIRELVKNTGISTEDLRRRLGFTTRGSIYKWYRGEALPSTENQLALKKILRLKSVDELFITKESEHRRNTHMTYIAIRKVINVKRTGDNIRRLMKEKDVCIEDIIRILNLSSKQSVYKWLRGDSIPSIDNLIILKDILSVAYIEDILVIEEQK